jgi:hypothetical protein
MVIGAAAARAVFHLVFLAAMRCEPLSSLADWIASCETVSCHLAHLGKAFLLIIRDTGTGTLIPVFET